MKKHQAPLLAKQLVAWYQAGHRMLPWRETTDPYAIWLSEIMLQQTQVATVLPYYERFLTRFPNISTLASAPIHDVLKLWEGLGYYARARNLHQAAQKIVQLHQGHFPDTLGAIEALPGIGKSTAGAIATFAFHQPHPILDGNVKRVLSRLYAVDGIIQETATIDILWQHSKDLLPADSETAYDFNQAIMELGASLCAPKNPDCPKCPWRTDCQAHLQGRQNDIPVRQPTKITPHYTIGVGVIYRNDDILIALRPAEGLLGGLWEFPGGKCQPEESLSECVHREILEETGLDVLVGAKITTVKHAYTHFKITMHAFACQYKTGTATPKASQEIRWVPLADLDRYAFPKANKTILEALKQNQGRQLTLC